MSLSSGKNSTTDNRSGVLIVEDDVAIRRLYKFLLANDGYQVVEAHDGITALDQLSQINCGMVITDINMPGMNGLELIKIIRRTYPHIYVIAITAYGSPDIRKQAINSGANEYLTKPLDFEDLERRVHAFFRNGAMPKP